MSRFLIVIGALAVGCSTPVLAQSSPRPESLRLFRYSVPESELQSIVDRMLSTAETRPGMGENLKVLYSDRGMSHFDSLIPYRPHLTEEPENPNNYNKWTFVDGRVRQIEQGQDGTRWLAQRIWYNDTHCPVLTVMYDRQGTPQWYLYGQYDDGKIRRVLQFHPGPRLIHVHVFDYSDLGLVRNKYHFSGLTGDLLYAHFDVHGVRYQYTAKTGKMHHWAGRANEPWYDRIPSLEEYGLARLYPEPIAQKRSRGESQNLRMQPSRNSQRARCARQRQLSAG